MTDPRALVPSRPARAGSAQLKNDACRDEFRLEQTSLVVGGAVCLRKSSEGFGWRGLYAAITDERAHVALHRVVPAVWIATSLSSVDVRRSSMGGSETRFRLTQGAASIAAPGEAFLDEIENPHVGAHVFLHHEILSDVLFELYDESSPRKRVVSKAPAVDSVLSSLVEAIRLALEEPPRSNSLKIDYLARAAAARLLHLYSAVGVMQLAQPADMLGSKQLHRICEYIDENIESDLRIEDLAAVAGVGRARFLRKFRMSTRLPPHRFVIMRRVGKAKRLLAETSLDVVEIAALLGFADHAHFAATFRRVVGVTASHYRKIVAG